MAWQALLALQTHLSRPTQYVCLNSDEFETDGVSPGATLTVLDTGVRYVATALEDEDGIEWTKLPAVTVTITAGAATDWLETLFTINLEADTGTAHATTTAVYEFDGTLIVPPGWLVYLAATKASVALYASSVVWKEIPINPVA